MFVVGVALREQLGFEPERRKEPRYSERFGREPPRLGWVVSFVFRSVRLDPNTCERKLAPTARTDGWLVGDSDEAGLDTVGGRRAGGRAGLRNLGTQRRERKEGGARVGRSSVV